MRALFLVAALAVATPAFAQTAADTRLTLADATTAPAGRTIIDGAVWQCDDGECTATRGSNQPAARACRRVVARLGPVTAFAYKGVTLSAEDLAACNAT